MCADYPAPSFDAQGPSTSAPNVANAAYPIALYEADRASIYSNGC